MLIMILLRSPHLKGHLSPLPSLLVHRSIASATAIATAPATETYTYDAIFQVSSPERSPPYGQTSKEKKLLPPKFPTLNMGMMSNPQKSCFASASQMAIILAELDKHPHPDIIQSELFTRLHELCEQRRDPNIPALSPQPLVDAVNKLNKQQFNIKNSECALDFMNSILQNIDLEPGYLANHSEVGTCIFCGQEVAQISDLHQNWISLTLPNDDEPVSIAKLLTDIRVSAPNTTLVCENHGTRFVPVAGRVKSQPGEVLILKIDRDVNQSTILIEPRENYSAWEGMGVKTVMGHYKGMSGHWVTFAKIDGVWWSLDSATISPKMINPFQIQNSKTNFTINVLVFKKLS